MQMYLSFRRNVNGTDVNLEPDEIPEFKILQYEKLNTSTSYEDFKYELVTKTKINVVDKRDEIEDGNYYISIYDENHTLLNEVAYNELAGDLISVENIIKEIELEEHKSYSVELRIKIRDRYYTLSYVNLTTDEEILGISTIDEWKKIQPNGNYIILPFGGFRKEDGTIKSVGSYGYYWTNELSENESSKAKDLIISENGDGSRILDFYDGNRCSGLTVRPVLP